MLTKAYDPTAAVHPFPPGPTPGAPPADGMFAPPVEPASDEPLTVLLARLGRVA